MNKRIFDPSELQHILSFLISLENRMHISILLWVTFLCGQTFPIVGSVTAICFLFKKSKHQSFLQPPNKSTVRLLAISNTSNTQRLLFLTLPSATVLVSFLKSRFNLRQTLSAKKHPIFQILISTPIKDFLWVITDITVLTSDSHCTIV